jgi:mannose-6-phosphate isomerase-like protein (cupin superfamily)
MDVVQAIGKVRFASARPQRVHVSRSDLCAVEMLCMEAGQEAKVTAGPWTYYVVMGTAGLTSGPRREELTAGQAATTGADEVHTVANAGEGRLVCLAVGPPR